MNPSGLSPCEHSPPAGCVSDRGCGWTRAGAAAGGSPRCCRASPHPSGDTGSTGRPTRATSCRMRGLSPAARQTAGWGDGGRRSLLLDVLPELRGRLAVDRLQRLDAAENLGVTLRPEVEGKVLERHPFQG